MELACSVRAETLGAGELLSACASDLAGKHSYSHSRNWPKVYQVEEDEDCEAVLVDAWVIGYIKAKVYRQHHGDFEARLNQHRGNAPDEAAVAWR